MTDKPTGWQAALGGFGRRTGRRRWLWGGALAALLLLAAAVAAVSRASWGRGAGPELTLYTVRPMHFTVRILERGDVESLDNVEIVCEVKNIVSGGYRSRGGRSGGSSLGLSRFSSSSRTPRASTPTFRLPSPASGGFGGSGSSRGGSGSTGGGASAASSGASSSFSRSSSSGASSSSFSSSLSFGVSAPSGRSGRSSSSFSGGSSSSGGSSRSSQYRSFTSGVQILHIVPNGARVKKGDLLVELDSAALEERLDEQELAVAWARADAIQANAAYENQITRNETALANAELAVKLAELALEQLDAKEGGAYQMALEQLDMQIKEALASQLVQKTNAEGVEALYRLGYRSKGDVSQQRLALLRAQRALAIQLSGQKDVMEHQYTKYKLQLQGDLETARRRLEQVKRDNEAKLAEAKAAKDAADRILAREEERLKEFREQLAKCKVYAPRDGIVAYPMMKSFLSSFTLIREGAFVRPRQTILILPGMDRMQVKASVHETQRNQIEVGMPAVIRVDSLPGVEYHGKVQSLAVMPDPGGIFNSDVKNYEAIISIDEPPGDLRPGMTAVAEILVADHPQALCVPVESVVEIDGEDWCYVQTPSGLERRRVQLGKASEELVEVLEGVRPGDQVVANPGVLPDVALADGRGLMR